MLKTGEPPRSFYALRLCVHFLSISIRLTSIALISAIIFQLWSATAGYEELAAGFTPIRNGAMFEWIITIFMITNENKLHRDCVNKIR